MNSVATTKMANMPIAVQLVGCCCAWPRSAPAAQAAADSAEQRRQGKRAPRGTACRCAGAAHFSTALVDLLGQVVELAVGALDVDTR